jgi:hypothetical protein
MDHNFSSDRLGTIKAQAGLQKPSTSIYSSRQLTAVADDQCLAFLAALGLCAFSFLQGQRTSTTWQGAMPVSAVIHRCKSCP